MTNERISDERLKEILSEYRKFIQPSQHWLTPTGQQMAHDIVAAMQELHELRVTHEPNSCASFPVTHEMGLWMEDYLNVLCEREIQDISLPQRQFLNDRIDAVRACIASATFTKGASRDTSPELHAKGCPCPDCLNGTTRSNVEQFASRDASPGPNAWADAKGGLPDNKL